MAVTKDKVRVAAYINHKLKEKAEKAAKKEGRSLSNFIEQLIKKEVEQNN